MQRAIQQTEDNIGAAAHFKQLNRKCLIFFFFFSPNCEQLQCYQGFFTSGKNIPPSLFKKTNKQKPPHSYSLSHNSTGLSLGLCVTIQNEALLFTTTAHSVVYVHWCTETVKGKDDRMGGCDGLQSCDICFF